MDVLVQLHHVREVLLKFTESFAVLSYYFLLRGYYSLQLFKSGGIFLETALELDRGGLWFLLFSFLAGVLFFGEPAKGFG